MAERLCRDATPVAASVAKELKDPDQVCRVLTEVAESFLNYRLVANREAEEAARLGAKAEVVAHRAVPVRRHPRPGRAARASASTSGDAGGWWRAATG